MEEPVAFTVSAPNPDAHIFEVTMSLTGLESSTLRVNMPVWTPGSYLIREYPQHLQRFEARGGNGLRLSSEKNDKATWNIRVGDARDVDIHYQIYAHDLGVRSKHLDDSHGFFNATALYLYPEGHKDAAVEVDIQPPRSDWKVYCPLELADGAAGPGASCKFRADNFDELFDAPVEMGDHDELQFDVDGVPHKVVFWGDGDWDADRLLRDMPDIVDANRSMFGDLPYDDYLFITLLSDDTYGGLEHRNSTALIYPKFEFGEPPSPGDDGVDDATEPPIEDDDYLNFLSLVAHEHFHVWNVKRIHPEVLDDIDYQREQYVRELWTIEGITSYYDRMALLRANLITPEKYLEIIGDRIARLQQAPGRHVQSLEEAGFDAWIKYYRRDEQTTNATVNYYLKGALVAMLLDFHIRRHSDGDHSLDDLMLKLWEAFERGEDGYEPGTHETLAGELAGRDLTDFFDAFIRGTEEIDWNAELERVGLKASPTHDEETPATWLGLTTEGTATQPTVATVKTDSPARDGGIHPGDDLVAVDGWQLTEEQNLQDRLDLFEPGETISVTLFRRQQLQMVEVDLREPPADGYELTVAPDATEAQRQLLEDWLGSSELPGSNS